MRLYCSQILDPSVIASDKTYLESIESMQRKQMVYQMADQLIESGGIKEDKIKNEYYTRYQYSCEVLFGEELEQVTKRIKQQAEHIEQALEDLRCVRKERDEAWTKLRTLREALGKDN